jgi:CTP synthase
MIFGLQNLQSYGINADFLCLRTHRPLDEYWRNYFINKINNYFNFHPNNIMLLPDLPSPYNIYDYLYRHNKNHLELLLKNIVGKDTNFSWNNVEEYSKITENIAQYENYKNQPQNIQILILGKYGQLYDSYQSIYHSLYHSSAHLKTPINIVVKNAQDMDPLDMKKFHGVIIPGGFGYKNTDKIMECMHMAKINNIPLLGICLGMQLMVIEGLKHMNIDSTSQEFAQENPQVKDLPWSIYLIDENKKKQVNNITGTMGGNMRLGNYECHLLNNSKAHNLYNKDIIFERHRHRYEVNGWAIPLLTSAGYVFSGINPQENLVEIIEYTPNDFFIGCQFHPEFKSKIHEPHPLFNGLLISAMKYYQDE